MGKFMDNASGIGAIASGASSLFGAFNAIGAGKRQKKLMDYQYKKEEAYQKNMAQHNWQNYNSPSAQRRAMEAAGINPFVGDSGLSPQQMNMNAGSPELQDPADPGAGFASNIQAGASSLFQMGEMKRVNDSIIAKNQADANQAQANANSTNMQLPGVLDLQELEKNLKALAGSNAELQNVILGIEAQYKKDQTIAGLEKMRQELNESIERTNLSISQQKLNDKLMSQIDQAIIESRSRIGVNNSQIGLNNASADLKSALLETENKLRDGRLRLTENQAREVLISAFGKEVVTMKGYHELAEAMTGTERASGWASLIDKYIERFSDGKQESSYDSRTEIYRRLVSSLAALENR